MKTTKLLTIVSFTLAAIAQAQEPPKITVDVMGFSVSKFRRDAAGNAANPFPDPSKPILPGLKFLPGTQIALMLTMPGGVSNVTKIDPTTGVSNAKLTKLVDSTGKDFLAIPEGAAVTSTFWGENRPITFLAAPDHRRYLATINAIKAPKSGAEFIEGVLEIPVVQGEMKPFVYGPSMLTGSGVIQDGDTVLCRYGPGSNRPRSPIFNGPGMPPNNAQTMPQKPAVSFSGFADQILSMRVLYSDGGSSDFSTGKNSEVIIDKPAAPVTVEISYLRPGATITTAVVPFKVGLGIMAE